VAPIGFLYIENIFATLCNNADWSLRIFPLLSFLTSIFLLFKLNQQLFKNNTIAIMAAALFSLNSFVLYYAIEVKQYMSDTLICLLILVSAVEFLNTKTRRSLFVFSFVAVGSVWFSNVAIILLFSAGLVVLYQMVITNKLKSFFGIIPLALGLVSFGCYYALFIHEHPAKEPMIAYWTQNSGFLYTDIFSWEFRYFLRTRLQSIIMVLLEIGKFWWITLIFMILGIVSNIKYKKALVLLCLPMCVHLALSYAKLYPFDRRLILYLVPLLITILVLGIYKSFTWLKAKYNFIPTYVLLIPFVINAVVIFKLLPIEKEEIKKSMRFVNANMEDSDQVYVYAVSEIPFKYYQHKFPKLATNKAIVYGELHRQDWPLHIAQLQQLQNDVWLVFSHINTKDTNNFTEEDYIVEALVNNGYHIAVKNAYEGSSIYKLEKETNRLENGSISTPE
jgi:4-amino-4-deoxy-L-arabinose transferase-like glycosyltransferase